MSSLLHKKIFNGKEIKQLYKTSRKIFLKGILKLNTAMKDVTGKFKFKKDICLQKSEVSQRLQ